MKQRAYKENTFSAHHELHPRCCMQPNGASKGAATADTCARHGSTLHGLRKLLQQGPVSRGATPTATAPALWSSRLRRHRSPLPCRCPHRRHQENDNGPSTVSASTERTGHKDRGPQIARLHTDRLARGVQGNRPARRSSIERAQRHAATVQFSAGDQTIQQRGLPLGESTFACNSRY